MMMIDKGLKTMSALEILTKNPIKKFNGLKDPVSNHIEMSEEIERQGYEKQGLKVGKYQFYDVGQTTISTLKKYKIIPNRDYKEYEKKQPDALMVDRRDKSRPSVIAVIEYKSRDEFKTIKDRLKATQQCNNYAQVLKAKIGIATDKSTFIWFNPNHKNPKNEYLDECSGISRNYSIIQDEDGNKFTKKFEIDQKTDDEETTRLNVKTRKSMEYLELLYSSLDTGTSHLTKEKPKDPTDLAKQIWQDIWMVTGKDPEKCLYTFIELFIFKYLSDLDILTVDRNGNKINFKNIIKLDPKFAFRNYHDNVRNHLKSMFKESTVDKTTIINGTVLNPEISEHGQVFYKILKRFEAEGQLKEIDPKFKSKVFEAFMKESISTKNWGRYFTPRNIIDAIIEMSDIDKLEQGSKICDPACGVGGFILEPMKVKKDVKFYYPIKNNIIKPRFEFYGYDKGFEKEEEQLIIILAKANMLIFLSELLNDNRAITDQFSNIFNSTFTLMPYSIMGTLDKLEYEKYDLILTNPPYVTSGSSNYKEKIKSDAGLKEFYSTNAMGVEGLFLEWIVNSLKLGKKAFIIIPDGILHRIYDSKLRKFIKDECVIDAIISLPVKAFYTTSKKTYILALTKKNQENKEDRMKSEQTEPVFTYLVSETGESLDSYRVKMDENDLLEMVCLFNQFKGSKSSFKTDSKLCKIQPIDRFVVDANWSVDRWWSKTEKIELGIEEEISEISKDEFLELLDEEHKKLEKIITNTKDSLKNFYTEYKYVEKTVDDLFKINRGSTYYTKKRIINNNWIGNIPVYSSKTKDSGLLVKIKKQHVKTKDDLYYQNCLTWTTDGYAGTIFIRNQDNQNNDKKSKYFFVITDHCGVLIPKIEKLYLPFIKRVLQPKFYERAKGYGKKELKLNQVKDIQIKIPVKDDGSLDHDKQKEIADLYETIDKAKEAWVENMKDIENYNVEVIPN